MAEKRYRKSASQTNEEALLALDGKLPPHNLDAEASVLGALLLEQSAFSRVSEIISADDFYLKKHQDIFRAIVNLSVNQIPIDLVSVTDQLLKDGTLESIGGESYITSLVKPVFSTPFLENHAHIILEKSLSRKLIALSSELLRNAYDSSIDVKETMQEAERKLFEVSHSNIRSDFKELRPVIGEVMQGIQLASNRTDGLSGLTSGFEHIDAITSGWQNSDLIIIAARPSMGKTAFVLSMARNMALDHNIPVAVFNLEMSSHQLGNRLVSNYCEIRADAIKSGSLTDDEYARLHASLNTLYKAPLYINDTPSLSVFELRSQARRLVSDKGVKAIIIDYLQLMNASGMGITSSEQEISTISRALKMLAKELNIPIIALSQLNRNVESRQNQQGESNSGRPQLSDLRGSGAIEQDADIVCFLHRPAYYKKFKTEKGGDLTNKGEFIIAKHRNGAIGEIWLEFKGAYSKFLTTDQNIDGDVGDISNLGSKQMSFKQTTAASKPVTLEADNQRPF